MKDNLLRISAFLYAFISIVNYFMDFDPLKYALLIVLIYVLLISVTNIKRTSLIIFGSIFTIAIILMIRSGADFSHWLEGLITNNLLISLFITGPLLQLPFTYEDYPYELKNIAKLYMRDLIPFAFLIAVPTHIFAALTAFAAFNIMYSLFSDTSKLYDAEDIFLSTLVRSYATSGFWGISWASVMLIVSMYQIPWYRFILVAMIFVPVSIGINLAGIKIAMLRRPGFYPVLEPDMNSKVDWRKIRIILGLAFGIVLVTLIVNQVTGWNLLAIVPLVSIIFPLLTAAVQKKKKELKKGVFVFYDKQLYKVRTEIFLFTSAGLLAYSLNISGLSAKIPELIPAFLISYPYLMVIALMLLMVIPGIVGVHPVASGTTLLAVIEPASIGLTVPAFLMAIVCAWSISNMLSPFSALNLTLSGLSGKSSWYTGLKLNWRYGMVCILLYSGMCLTAGQLLVKS